MARTITATADLRRHALSLNEVGALVPGTGYVLVVGGLPAGLSSVKVKLFGEEGAESSEDDGSDGDGTVYPSSAAMAPVTGHPNVYASATLTVPVWRKGMTSVLCRVEAGDDVYVSCRLPVTPVPEAWK